MECAFLLANIRQSSYMSYRQRPSVPDPGGFAVNLPARDARYRMRRKESQVVVWGLVQPLAAQNSLRVGFVYEGVR